MTVNRYSPYHDPDEGVTQMSIDANGSWVHITTYEKLKAATALCEKHLPTGGARSHCLVCALVELNAALSKIDYLCGEENEYECSMYDIDCNEERVVDAVRAMRAELMDTARLLGMGGEREAAMLSLIDKVDTLAVNDTSGCKTCSAVQNLTTGYLQSRRLDALKELTAESEALGLYDVTEDKPFDKPISK